MKKVFLFASVFALMSISVLNAQVTIGDLTEPQVYSILELSTVKNKGGLRLPQLTTQQRNDLTTAAFKADAQAKGLLIFNITTNLMEEWDGTDWIPLLNLIDGDISIPVGNNTATVTKIRGQSISDISPINGQTLVADGEGNLIWQTLNSSLQPSWSLTGNTGTSTSNFLGTTNNAPLILKVNNEWAGFTGFPGKDNVSFGYLSQKNALAGTGIANTSLGAWALEWNDTTSGNVAIGTWALQWLTQGDRNVAIGMGAIHNTLTPGSDNVAIGANALTQNSQDQNIAIGSHSAQFNTTGQGITAIGFKTLNANTTGEFNTALGYQALLINTVGKWNVALGSGSLQWNTTGRFNTAGGNSSMHFNSEGIENTGFGEQALGGNINGSYNTAVGCRSLHSVIFIPPPGIGDTGYGNGDANTAIGYESLQKITDGGENVGVGLRALWGNNTGSYNVAIGGYALAAITGGNENIAIGDRAIGDCTTSQNGIVAIGTRALRFNAGAGNTAIGHESLMNNTTGSSNTAIGYQANVSVGDLTNATAIGHGAVATANNQVMIGNSNVTSIVGYVPWTTISDGRVNKNIKQSVPGLEFINLLQPVTYNLDLDTADKILGIGKSQEKEVDTNARERQQKRVYTGFVAQEVEKSAQSIGYDFSGVSVAENENGLYGLQYSEFVVPLVKAVQELSMENKAKDTAIASLKDQVSELTELVNQLLGK